MVKLINKFVDDGEALDFGRLAQYLTLDTITDLAYSEPFGDLSSNEDKYDYIYELESSLPFIIQTTNLPWMMSLLQFPMLSALTPNARNKKGLGKVVRSVGVD